MLWAGVLSRAVILGPRQELLSELATSERRAASLNEAARKLGDAADEKERRKVVRFFVSVEGTTHHDQVVFIDVPALVDRTKQTYMMHRRDLNLLFHTEGVEGRFVAYLPNHARDWQNKASLEVANGRLNRPIRRPSRGSLRDFLFRLKDAGILLRIEIGSDENFQPIEFEP